jgi:hypothetical protein
MNANMIASALVAELRTAWRKWAIVAGVGLVVLVVLYKLVMIFVLTDENRPASEEIVAAVEAYKVSNKRYPEKLAQLQPKYLGKIPRPAPGTNFVYGVSSDGTAAWVGYQTSRGGLTEYDSSTRKWRDIDYDDSDALRMRTKEFVMGPK